MPPLTLHEMQAIHGTLSIFSQGYHYTASINLSGVTSVGAGVKEIGTALNAHLPQAAATTRSSIASETVHFTGSVNAGVLTVDSVSSGKIEVGSMISGKGIPTGTNITNQPQITAQLSGTPGGAGTYALFLREGYISSEHMTDSYGLLTVGSTSKGQVKAGEQVSGTNVLAHTAIEESFNPSGTGKTWVVDLSQNVGGVSGENMTMTGAPLYLNYKKVEGATEKTDSGHFLLQQWPTFDWESSSLTWMTGSAAGKLGMSQSDSGSPQGAFLSSTGEIVTSPSAWMGNFVANFSDEFSSFQTTYSPKKATPPGEQAALEQWASSYDAGLYTYLHGYSANTPPICQPSCSIMGASIAQLSVTPLAAVPVQGATVPKSSTWVMI